MPAVLGITEDKCKGKPWDDGESYRPLPWHLVETANTRRRLEYQIEVDPDRNCIVWEKDREGNAVDPESPKYFALWINYDYEFPEKTLVLLRNGDQLSGSIRTTSIGFLTTYGKLSIPIEDIVCIQFEGESRPNAIVEGKNGERFSGSVLDPSISIEQTATGLELQLRKEKIESIVFPVERSPRAPRDKTIFHMRNGDTFWGSLISEQVSVDTEFGALTVSVENIAEIELVGNGALVSKIILLGGDTFRGIIHDEDFEISVAGGEPIKIYRDKFARIVAPYIR